MIFLPISSSVSFNVAPVASLIAVPSASHWLATFAAGSVNSAGVPVRVLPTCAVPLIFASFETSSNAMTGPTASETDSSVSSPRVAVDR